MSTKTCHDCGAWPGEEHDNGCDVERCRGCGRQRISCSDQECQATEEKLGRLKWTGEWPGKAEAREFGWYSKRNPDGPGWISCSKDEPGASEDLNRLYDEEVVWSPESGRFMLCVPLPRQCKTPGTMFHTTFHQNVVKVKVELPKKMRVSEEQASQIEDKIHDALEEVLSVLFK